MTNGNETGVPGTMYVNVGGSCSFMCSRLWERLESVKNDVESVILRTRSLTQQLLDAVEPVACFWQDVQPDAPFGYELVTGDVSFSTHGCPFAVAAIHCGKKRISPIAIW
jgi:hypothetical protein